MKAFKLTDKSTEAIAKILQEKVNSLLRTIDDSKRKNLNTLIYESELRELRKVRDEFEKKSGLLKG